MSDGNIATQFQKLLPSKLMQSGEVTAFDSFSATVAIPSAAAAKGKSVWVALAGKTVAVGDHVFIRGGEVVGEAPSLAVYEVTV